jgi:hypothetical protein
MYRLKLFYNLTSFLLQYAKHTFNSSYKAAVHAQRSSELSTFRKYYALLTASGCNIRSSGIQAGATCVISGFHPGKVKAFAVLVCYAVEVGSWLKTFRYNQHHMNSKRSLSHARTYMRRRKCLVRCVKQAENSSGATTCFIARADKISCSPRLVVLQIVI